MDNLKLLSWTCWRNLHLHQTIYQLRFYTSCCLLILILSNSFCGWVAFPDDFFPIFLGNYVWGTQQLLKSLQSMLIGHVTKHENSNKTWKIQVNRCLFIPALLRTFFPTSKIYCFLFETLFVYKNLVCLLFTLTCVK